MHDQRNDSILSRRGRLVRDGDRADGPVVYWMSREQRVRDNRELLAAQEEVLRLRKPLAVVFYLNPDFPGTSLRHYMVSPARPAGTATSHRPPGHPLPPAGPSAVSMTGPAAREEKKQ